MLYDAVCQCKFAVSDLLSVSVGLSKMTSVSICICKNSWISANIYPRSHICAPLYQSSLLPCACIELELEIAHNKKIITRRQTGKKLKVLVKNCTSPSSMLAISSICDRWERSSKLIYTPCYCKDENQVFFKPANDLLAITSLLRLFHSFTTLFTKRIFRNVELNTFFL